MTEHHLEDYADAIKPKAASNLLLWAIAAFFLLALLWAAFTQLDRVVHGQGRVVPTAQVQIVSNLEGGVVRQILVKAGQRVAANAPLVRLDTTATGAELGSNQIAFEAARVKVNRLEAEITGRAPVFPVTENPVLGEQIAIERSLYMSRQADLSSLTAAGSARAIQAQRAVAEAQANLDAATAARDAAKQQADILRPLVANGIEPRVSLIQADRQASVSASQVAQAAAALARARSGVAEANALLNQARQDWRAKAAADLATAQAEMAARRQSLPALEDKVNRTVVRAPLAGRINRVFVTTVGGTIRPAEPIAEIVPENSGLTIDVAIRPEDIAFVRLGQRAVIKLSAYDYSIYGGLEGTVTNISPDAIVVDQKSAQSEYMIKVQAKEPGLRTRDGRLLPIGPGMLADVNLIGDKRSILNYILTPITRMSENAFRE